MGRRGDESKAWDNRGNRGLIELVGARAGASIAVGHETKVGGC